MKTFNQPKPKASKLILERGFKLASFWLSCLFLVAPAYSQAQQSQEATPESIPRYRIQLKLDFDALSYSGTEQVRWTNRSERPTSTLYFHLYSNLRPDAPVTPADSVAAETEEPRIQISEVRSLATGAPLSYSIDNHGTSLRITLAEPISPGNSTEVVVGFKGNVPEVDAEETGLTTHVVKQVSAALRGERETRRPLDLNFRCRGVMMLGTFYPMLAVNHGGEWLRKLEPSVGDVVFNEVADYEVKIETAPGVMVFTSASEALTNRRTRWRRFFPPRRYATLPLWLDAPCAQSRRRWAKSLCDPFTCPNMSESANACY